jgi:hypothetical protein
VVVEVFLVELVVLLVAILLELLASMVARGKRTVVVVVVLACAMARDTKPDRPLVDGKDGTRPGR